MKKYFKTLENSLLFRGIPGDELEQLIDCLGATKQLFLPSEVILAEGQPAQQIGILLYGRAQVIREDRLGNRNILAEIEPGELFAETFACASEASSFLSVTVLSVTQSGVLLFDYQSLICTCPSFHKLHTLLIKNMLSILANKNLLLNRRLGHLSKRTTREKVLSYLTEQATLCGSAEFHIPFNRQQLADYLCVERSAMSAVLSQLRREGLLDFHKNHFFLKL